MLGDIWLRQHFTYVSHSIKRLQSCTVSCSCKQNATVINNIKKILIKFCSISLTLVLRNQSFTNLHKVSTPTWNFDFCLSEFEFEFKTDNIQCWSDFQNATTLSMMALGRMSFNIIQHSQWPNVLQTSPIMQYHLLKL